MVSPFDLRSALLAKHAQHVVLIHFPIALFMAGVGLDLLSRGRRESQFASAAYLNLSMAAATAIPALLTGLLAWQFAFEGKRLKGLLLFHLLAASTATMLILASWWIHRRSRRLESAVLPRVRLWVEFLGVAALGMAAHLGGFLSGLNS